MTDILPPAGWLNVRQLETNEFATGGANGNMNEQAKSLAARSELLKQYVALPYESKTSGYALNERVQLATGDIVRSTIASNVNNPNVDITGWVNVAAWSSIESKPTTVAGYGITDAYTKTEVDTAIANATPTIPDATQTVAGKAKIATQYETNVAADDTRFVTPKKLFAGLTYHLNVTGNAPMYACRAWVNFNGTGTVAIRASGNVSSITDNGNGDYTVNFTIAMQDALYIPFLSYAGRSGDTLKLVVTSATEGGTPTLKTASAIRVNYGSIDLNEVYIGIIR